jgi:hypothetical protein
MAAGCNLQDIWSLVGHAPPCALAGARSGVNACVGITLDGYGLCFSPGTGHTIVAGLWWPGEVSAWSPTGVQRLYRLEWVYRRLVRVGKAAAATR